MIKIIIIVCILFLLIGCSNSNLFEHYCKTTFSGNITKMCALQSCFNSGCDFVCVDEKGVGHKTTSSVYTQEC